MKKNKIALFALSLVAVAAVGVGSTLAYFTDSDEATNVFTMGDVDIELTEPEWEGDKVDVVPGDVYAKDPTITVADDSQPCYVRADLEVEGLDGFEGYAEDLLDSLDINTGWVEDDNGYFWPKALKAGEEVVLFDEITIPVTWGNEVREVIFSLNVSASAIQAANVGEKLEDGSYADITEWPDVDGTDEVEPQI